MIKLFFHGDRYTRLSSQLLDSVFESCAIVLANVVDVGGEIRLLVSEVIIAPPEAYAHRKEEFAELKPEFIVPIAKRARANRNSIIFCHTHPASVGEPFFSPIDDQGERQLALFLADRVPEVIHAALVIGPGGCRARKLGANEEVGVVEVGTCRRVLFSPNTPANAAIENHDRQIRAFGKQGQADIERLKIGIVGLGGTGSIVANQLAHLGCKNFVLIDPDEVETTNLNRLVGSIPEDIGILKVDVAKRAITTVSPSAKIVKLKGNITDDTTAKELISSDFIFCCTDSHASRAVINQVAYQYFIPCIDMGVSISTKDGVVAYITGRVQMLSPGLGCLACGNILDGNIIRREMMNDEQREADPYFQGGNGEPQPAVISLNGTMSSLAITMFLGAVTNIPATARLQFYDGIKGVLRSAVQSQNPSCIVCSENGALGLGHQWALPVKRSNS